MEEPAGREERARARTDAPDKAAPPPTEDDPEGAEAAESHIIRGMD
ncbi:hypothetical protein [Streptomyces hesseae]|uniref:Uncharacterized protein n=1 Tax=Streptomyces hesseae TaxID=3075519 RepID=A0ABU2SQD3_9ACTN|nr:hypothetical protein [Streptomyces sp. DSM 40473]MDT0450015.1 hypothetical protein [Streptomyces sp. DSM 40473]